MVIGFRPMRSIAAYALLAVWIASYSLLAIHSVDVFHVLVYDESSLMPDYLEPSVVDRILSSASAGHGGEAHVSTPILVYSPNLTGRLKALNSTLSEGGFTVISPYNIEYTAQKIYWDRINETINNLTNLFLIYLNKSYIEIDKECIYLTKLRDAYSEALDNATRLLYATYGAAVLNISTAQTRQFLQYFKEYEKSYGLDEAVRLAADKAYGNVSWLLQNVTWRNWASRRSAELIAERILSTRLNYTLISLARNVSELGVEKYIYYHAVSNAPAELRPYIPYVLCRNETAAAVAVFKSSLARELSERYPPPTVYSIPQASLLLHGEYAVAIAVGATRPSLDYAWAVPVSTDILMSQFTQIVTSEVPEIDKTTAAVLLAVLLFIFGTLAAPLIVLAEVGLTYLALLGLLYLTSKYMPPYYLAVYITAPIVFALGVDYNLLILGRYAEERGKGSGKDDAVATSLAFARRAVLTSAIVAASALGSFGLSRLPFMQSIGLSFVLSVLLVLSTTFAATPSILHLLGDRIFWPRRAEDIRLHEGRSGLLGKAVDLALSKSKIIIIIFVIITILLSIFILNNIKITTDPIMAMPETPAKRALEILTTYFKNITALSTTYLAIPYEPPRGLLNDVTKLPYYINYSIYNITYLNHIYYIIKIKMALTGTSDRLLQVYYNISALRDKYGFFYIGGAAGWKHVYYQNIFIYFWHTQIYIIIFFILFTLAIALRSVFMPMRLVATVLISLVWGLALNIAVFQMLAGQLTYWLQPVVLSTLLIAVGTDYDVFIVSRIREEAEKGLDDRSAIRTAIVTTGPVVTGAALILALAFLSIVQSQLTVLQQVGVTVAFAAVFDAYVVRPLLVPAVMNLLAKYNWWFPAPPRRHRRKAARGI